MAQTKHRDDQLFTAPVEFNDTVQFDAQVTFNAGFVRTKQLFVPAYLGKVGATAGWVIGGSNSGLVTLPASQTASTIVIPLAGLEIGDLVTGIQALAQIESAGGTVSWTLDAYREDAAAADFAQTAIGTQDTGSVTADTYIGPSGGDTIPVGGTFSIEQTDGRSMYAVLGMTTAASTDVALAGLLIDVTMQ